MYMYKINYTNNRSKSIMSISEFQSGGSQNSFESALNNGVHPSKSTIKEAGNGVFASKDFSKEEVLEVSPILAIPMNDAHGNILKDYVFNYGDGLYGVALGYGAVYNHQDIPNVSYTYSDNKKFMVYKANRDIKKGEELFVSYGQNWWMSRDINLKK